MCVWRFHKFSGEILVLVSDVVCSHNEIILTEITAMVNILYGNLHGAKSSQEMCQLILFNVVLS